MYKNYVFFRLLEYFLCFDFENDVVIVLEVGFGFLIFVEERVSIYNVENFMFYFLV